MLLKRYFNKIKPGISSQTLVFESFKALTADAKFLKKFWSTLNSSKNAGYSLRTSVLPLINVTIIEYICDGDWLQRQASSGITVIGKETKDGVNVHN